MSGDSLSAIAKPKNAIAKEYDKHIRIHRYNWLRIQSRLTLIMSQLLTLELSDEIYAELERQASAAGLSVAEWVVESLKKQPNSQTDLEREKARQSLLRYAGSISLGHTTGIDNETIDADLAKAYTDDF